MRTPFFVGQVSGGSGSCSTSGWLSQGSPCSAAFTSAAESGSCSSLFRPCPCSSASLPSPPFPFAAHPAVRAGFGTLSAESGNHVGQRGFSEQSPAPTAVPPNPAMEPTVHEAGETVLRHGPRACTAAQLVGSASNETIRQEIRQMKASILLVLICAILASPVSLAADDADRPAGVEAQNWLPISVRPAFVVVPENDRPHIAGASRQVLLADPGRVSANLQPPKKGYFVIKTEAGWLRVVVAEPSELAG